MARADASEGCDMPWRTFPIKIGKLGRFFLTSSQGPRSNRLVVLLTVVFLFGVPFASNAQGSGECLQITQILYGRAIIDPKTSQHTGTFDLTTDADYSYLTVSPDGKAVAYLRYLHEDDPSVGPEHYQLIVQPANMIATQSTPEVQGTPEPIIMVKHVVFNGSPDPNAKWSPDSRWLADLWIADDHRAYLSMVDKSGHEAIRKSLQGLKYNHAYMVGWSGDGNFLSVELDQDDDRQPTHTIIILSWPGLTPIKTISTTPAANAANNASPTNVDEFQDAQWAGSDHWLALLDGYQRTATLISPDDQKPIVDDFTGDNKLDPGNPAAIQLWSPDGKYLAVALYHPDEDLWRIDILGTDRQVIQHVSDKARRFVGGDGSNTIPHFYWSSDGSSLYYTESYDIQAFTEANLLAYPVKAHKAALIAHDVYLNPQITEGNEFLFYERKENDKTILDVVNTDTEHLISVPLSDASNGLLSGWYSPQSRSLLIEEPKSVVMVDTVHGTSHVSNLAMNENGSRFVTTDSRYVFSLNADATPPTINLYGIDNGEAETIPLPPSTDISNANAVVAVSSDGTLIALSTAPPNTPDGEMGILIVNRKGAVIQQLKGVPFAREMTFVPCPLPSK